MPVFVMAQLVQVVETLLAVVCLEKRAICACGVSLGGQEGKLQWHEMVMVKHDELPDRLKLWVFGVVT
jgi:hypothetical protein